MDDRALARHVDGLSNWLVTLPAPTAWRWQSRLLVCAPMALTGLVAVVMVLAMRPWRALPLLAFAIGMLAAPLILAAVPSADRETHVGLWAVSVGVLTALGSELWN